MIMPPRAGITLVENGTVQTWTHPDQIDPTLPGYIAGVNILEIEYSEGDDQADLNLNDSVVPGNIVIMAPIAEQSFTVPINGYLYENTTQYKNAALQFFNNHNSIAKPRIYLIKCERDDYARYPDQQGIMRPYVAGYLKIMAIKDGDFEYTIRGIFRVESLI